MAGSTPIYGIPYPESSDLVANYPALGEGLADKLEDKLPTYAGTAPTSPSVGQVWIDSSGTPIGKVWDGSDWTIFSGAGAANFSDTATGTYTDANGIDWKYKTYTGSGTCTITTAGECRILVLGGGGAGYNAAIFWDGKGGYSVRGTWVIPTGTYTITIGAGGTSNSRPELSAGQKSSFGSLFVGFAGCAGGRPTGSNSSDFSDDITGTSVTYAAAAVAAPSANKGEGGQLSGNVSGSSGVVIIAVRL